MRAIVSGKDARPALEHPSAYNIKGTYEDIITQNDLVYFRLTTVSSIYAIQRWHE